MATTSRRQLLQLALAQGMGPVLVRHARAADLPRFALGVASGQPQPNGLVLWTRLTGEHLPPEVAVDWELAEDDAFRLVVARGSETATPADAHSVHAEVKGLRPERWYWYRFTALGQRSGVGRTRTAPAADAEMHELELAIASGQRYDQGHYAAWRHAAAERLDLVLFLGDYIYEAGSPPDALRSHAGGRIHDLEGYRQRYAQYKSDPALQAAHAACPWLVIWDDHEVANDYAGWQGQRLEPDFAALRTAGYQAWWEHMPLPKAMRPVAGRARIHQRLDWGRLARIQLLDARQYRDPQACPKPGRGGTNTVRRHACPALADPARSMLGAEQERWLAEGWALDRTWNLLAQTTLMARCSLTDTAQGGTYWTDGWDGYAANRQRLLAGVAERRVPGAVVLSGDVHANYVADLKVDFDDPRAPVVASEFCGTSISSQGAPQARLDRLRGYNPHLHWARSDQRGYVQLRIARESLVAQLQVVQDVRDPQSPVGTAAEFAVAAQRPGVRVA